MESADLEEADLVVTDWVAEMDVAFVAQKIIIINNNQFNNLPFCLLQISNGKKDVPFFNQYSGITNSLTFQVVVVVALSSNRPHHNLLHAAFFVVVKNKLVE